MPRTVSDKIQDLHDKIFKRRIERNRATVQEAYRRYEAIKTKYDRKSKRYPFILRDDSCEIKTWISPLAVKA